MRSGFLYYFLNCYKCLIVVADVQLHCKVTSVRIVIRSIAIIILFRTV